MDGCRDAIAWLYCEGKSAFDRKDFAEALHSFEFCLQKLAAEHARQHGSTPFDAEHTGYRHLDEYLSFCRTRLEKEMRSPDSRASLEPSRAEALPRATGSPQTPSLLTAGPWTTRETLIFVCSPQHPHLRLPQLTDEAVDVANVTSAHIRRGGTAEDLQSELLANGYRAFLFSGHGDAELSGKETTLGFTGASGGLETVRAEHLAEMLGAHSPSHAGTLETVFLNGCATEQIGAQVHAAGVPYVVCWQTKAHTRAAHLLAATFFKSLASGRGHRKSFEDALSAVKLVTRPGKTASGIPSAVPAYELRDPLEPATNVSGFTPAPVAAGIPVLLCADRE